MSLINVTLFLFIFIIESISSRIDSTKRLIPCFPKTTDVRIVQFDRRIPLTFINCTRQTKTNLFTITFEFERQSKYFDQHLIVTIFAGPCSSSTATLTTGRTFPSTYAALDGSDRSTIVSSHLSLEQRIQQGTIAYEYLGSGAEFSHLASILIHVVIRHGRDELIRGTYAIQFPSRTTKR